MADATVDRAPDDPTRTSPPHDARCGTDVDFDILRDHRPRAPDLPQNFHW